MTPLKGDEEAMEGAVHGFPGMPFLSHHCPHLTLPPHSAASFSANEPFTAQQSYRTGTGCQLPNVYSRNLI